MKPKKIAAQPKRESTREEEIRRFGKKQMEALAKKGVMYQLFLKA